MLSGKHDYEWVVTMDTDDHRMNNQAVKDWLDGQKNVWYCYGNNTSKISAINANMENRNFDILILISDDMLPIVSGYDDIIAEHMFKNFSDLSGCLHFNDGRVGSVLNTLSIMGKGLYDRFGYIYHPQYTSLWCDNEFSEVTKMWNKTVYIDQIIVKHEWTDATGQDKLHKHNESYYETDKTIFYRRQQAGFPREVVGPPLRRVGRVKDRRRRVR